MRGKGIAPYVLAAGIVAVGLLAPAPSVNAQVVTTVVGGGACDTCPATEAVLNNPSDILLDGLGNTYVADFNNHRIRKVDAFGVITTVAGNGLKGFKGDGGPATAASLNNPFGLALDPSGNLVFSESGNHRLRKVDLTTGIITTIAGTGPAGFLGDGGPATAARLNTPRHILIAPSGEIYIADLGNQRVRKIDVSGIITTIAGDGVIGYSGDGGPAINARFYNPFSFALDGQGNLFVSDVDNHRVRRISTTGIITTVVGNGTNIFGGDGGRATLAGVISPTRPAFDAAGNLYVPSSIPEHRVRKVVPGADGLITGAADEIITTIAGNGVGGYGGDGGPATAAAVFRPFAVSVDNAGNLLIADLGNLRLRRIDPSGTITTVGGNGLCCYSADQRPAIHATLNFPTGIALDASGNYYIADRDNHRIRVVNKQGAPVTIAGLTIQPGHIRTIAGNGTAGYGGDGGASTAALVNSPYFIEVDSSGAIYFSDYGNQRIRKINALGVITTVVGNGAAGFSGDGGPAVNAALNGPFGLAFDSQGNLFFSDLSNHRVRRVGTTGIISTVAGNGSTAFAGDGGRATLAAISYPTELSFDAAGNLYIPVSLPQHRVRKVVPGADSLITGAADEIITTVAGNGTAGYGGDGGPATGASLNRPYGTVTNSTGTIYIADAYNYRIRTVDPANTISTAIGNGTKTHLIDFEGGNIAPANLTDELGDGAAGPSATTGFPAELVIQGTSLLFADAANHRIRGLGVSTADTAPPTVPANLTASDVQCNSVTLTWNASSDNVGVTEYRVYRDTILIATVLVAVPLTPTYTYTDTTVAASTSYTYSVSAVDAATNESSQQVPPLSVTTPACPGDTTPPVLTVPADMTVEATGPSGAVVTFTATATDDTDPSPTVTCTPPSGSTFPIGTTTVTCTATDALGNTSAPQTFTITVQDTTAPSVPTGLSASNVPCNQVTLSWTASTDAVGVTAYNVYRDATLIATVTAPATSYTDLTVAASTTYSYTVAAADNAGNTSAQSTALSVTTPACGPESGATIKIEPETVNKDSSGVPISVFISMESGPHLASEIQINNGFTMNMTFPTPLPSGCSTPTLPHMAGSEIFTGSNQLNVKFDRQSVENCVNVGATIVLTVTGTFIDGHTFSGWDTVSVIQ